LQKGEAMTTQIFVNLPIKDLKMNFLVNLDVDDLEKNVIEIKSHAEMAKYHKELNR
jgi:hypothetical protein